MWGWVEARWNDEVLRSTGRSGREMRALERLPRRAMVATNGVGVGVGIVVAVAVLVAGGSGRHQTEHAAEAKASLRRSVQFAFRRRWRRDVRRSVSLRARVPVDDLSPSRGVRPRGWCAHRSRDNSRILDQISSSEDSPLELHDREKDNGRRFPGREHWECLINVSRSTEATLRRKTRERTREKRPEGFLRDSESSLQIESGSRSSWSGKVQGLSRWKCASASVNIAAAQCLIYIVAFLLAGAAARKTRSLEVRRSSACLRLASDGNYLVEIIFLCTLERKCLPCGSFAVREDTSRKDVFLARFSWYYSRVRDPSRVRSLSGMQARTRCVWLIAWLSTGLSDRLMTAIAGCSFAANKKGA